MSKRLSLMDLFERKNSVLIALAISVVGFLCLEMVIYIASASSSGEYSRIEVKDKQGYVVYRTSGNTVSHIDRWYFERKHGNLENYDVEIKSVNKPFPVRAWVSASVGVPIVLILLISYLIRVYLTLLHGSEPERGEGFPVVYGQRHPFISWTMFLSSHSIFYLGAAIGFLALTFWMVPNFLSELVEGGMNVIKENKWFALTPFVLLAVIALWIAYLRYRLSKRMMDHQFYLEKYRLDREAGIGDKLPVETSDAESRQLKV